MRGSSLDNLARSLAQPISRRRALRLMGAAALAAVVPGVTTRRAHATPPDCKGICRDKGLPTLCQHDIATCTPYTCCGGSQPMCCAGPASATCCKAGCSCGDDGRGFKACQNCPRCDAPYTDCGKDACCGPHETCAGPSGVCCPRGVATCGKKCCDPGQHCENASKGLCSQCAKGHEACGPKCCPAGTYCCDERKGVCCRKKGGGCCNLGSGKTDDWTCCNAPNKCTRLADASGFASSDADRICCPPSRLADPKNSTSKCCPPGMKGLGRFISRPGTTGGMCCPEASVCGSGDGLNCCIAADNPLGARFAEVCCKGKCVNPDEFQSDPENCGTCGHACKKLVETCVRGVCAKK